MVYGTAVYQNARFVCSLSVGRSLSKNQSRDKYNPEGKKIAQLSSGLSASAHFGIRAIYKKLSEKL